LRELGALKENKMTFQFKHLFTPFKFRTFEVKNRIVLPPMAIYIPGCEGFVRQKLLDYYEARAAGGVGYIVVNATWVHPNGSSHPNQTSIADDKYVPGLTKLVEVIHRHDVKTVIQLYHSGRQRFARIAGGETISPSGIPCPVRKDPARAPTIEEIHSLVEDYGRPRGGPKKRVSMVSRSTVPTATCCPDFSPLLKTNAPTSTVET
jgi:2,4-dienoyl-CoA reductase-like NADH-dependent reductase (Old Yellow Enzyme family)